MEFTWDVVVVGAGMAGLLVAYYLQEEGKKVLVLEADKVASGQTRRTTAKITSQHALKYDKLIRTVGVEKARMYARANEEAIQEYERLIQSKGIECGFERVPAYLYTKQDALSLEKEAKAADVLNVENVLTLLTDSIVLKKETELPLSIKAALCFPNQAQFFPLEFVKYIASQLEVREYTKVLSVKGNRVITEKGEVTADKIVIATHYPILNVPGFYFLRQHQERSYVLALSGCDKIKGMYYGIDKDGLSLRQEGDLLLLGGSGCRTGANKEGGAFRNLEQAAEKYFPGCRVEGRWAAQDCMPHDGIPFIGKYSVFTPNLYVVTGFQKWGMTSSMVAAMILRDTLSGRENPYQRLFSPQRLHFRASMGKLLIDVGVSVKGLLIGWLGKKSKRCPHLGCELVWNPDEKSWDCPCHGSRFEEDGALLDNPSKKSKSHS